MRKIIILAILACFIFAGTGAFAAVKSIKIPSDFTEASKECIGCHKELNVNIYQHWGKSKHFRANVGCFECHEAQKGDVDAFEHEGKLISIIVSPNDCAKCHAKEVDEFVNSHHAKAGRIMGSLDNIVVINVNFCSKGLSSFELSGRERKLKLLLAKTWALSIAIWVICCKTFWH